MICIHKKEEQFPEIDNWMMRLNRWITRAGFPEPKAHNLKDEIGQIYKIIRHNPFEDHFYLFSIYYELIIFYQTEIQEMNTEEVVKSFYEECLVLLKNTSEIDKTEGSAIWEVLNKSYDIPLERVLEG